MVLQNHKNMCDFMQGNGMQEEITHLFKIISEIQPPQYSNRFLREEEVVMILAHIIQSICQMKEFFRKVHELVITVPRFVKQHRTIGLLSEQSSESLHAAVKMEARSLDLFSTATDQLRLRFVRQEIRANTDKKLLERENRFCKNIHPEKNDPS